MSRLIIDVKVYCHGEAKDTVAVSDDRRSKHSSRIFYANLRRSEFIIFCDSGRSVARAGRP